ncbi:MAG: response regulator [Alphaproteobacteria bacterium]|nr:response regulator [Alphaproteobacteria bacterium]
MTSLNYANCGLSVLIVDDYKTMLRVLRNLLGQIGIMNIDEAADGEAALSLIKYKKYDLIISDWSMEPMSGMDLLKAVRTGNDNETAFIMVSAESAAEKVIAAREAGVDNYIIKPFTADTLKNKIEQVLGGCHG